MEMYWLGFSFENRRKANKVAAAFAENSLTIKRDQFDKHSNGANSWCTIYMVYAQNPGTMDAKAFADKCNRIYQQAINTK